MEQVTTLQGHNGTVYALTYMQTPSGILIFSASYDRTIRVSKQTLIICCPTYNCVQYLYQKMNDLVSAVNIGESKTANIQDIQYL